MELHLAGMRNVFLKAELGLDIVGVVVAFVAAIAGIFGMNIQNGYESDTRLFWGMGVGMTSLCFCAVMMVLLVFRRLKL